MKKAISIPDLLAGETKEEKGIEFTHSLTVSAGWIKINFSINDFTSIVYLGKCSIDGDMFCGYQKSEVIIILKGHLNNGTY